MLKPIHLLRHHGTNKQEKYPRNMPAIVHLTTNITHAMTSTSVASWVRVTWWRVSRLSALDIAPLPVILLRGCSGSCQYQDIADTELADMRIAVDTVIIKGLSVKYVIGFCRQFSTHCTCCLLLLDHHKTYPIKILCILCIIIPYHTSC